LAVQNDIPSERLQLRKYIHTDERARFLALVMALSQIVELPAQIPSICPDPDDDRVIACAVVGCADVIVSSDQHLLGLKQVGEIDVFTPAQFLAVLKA
jgi:putative PIN family toxin of toxin-antitoxin system